MSESSNDFPKIGINTADLVAAVEQAIAAAFALSREEDFGAVNWGDLGVVDVEYRMSMLRPNEGPTAVVMVEEASPDSKLAPWLTRRAVERFGAQVRVECEW